MTQSVSFRITRTAEDVAQTLNALSQRLIKLENRLESLELQLERKSSDADAMPMDEIERLDGVDRLLTDCRDLLLRSEPQWWSNPTLICARSKTWLPNPSNGWHNLNKATYGSFIHQLLSDSRSDVAQPPKFLRRWSPA